MHQLIEIVARGGNLLLNIGPTADGRIPVIMQQRLSDMGGWLKVNREGIMALVSGRKHLPIQKERPCFLLKKIKTYLL